MESDIPKQFLPLNGVPVIIHTVLKFLEYDPKIQVVIALPQKHFQLWKELCLSNNFTFDHTLSAGGETRFETVKMALDAVDDDRVVAIHDAVRPLVTSQLIDKGFRDAMAFGNAIPVVRITDSVRWTEGKKNQPVDREPLRIVQTPQVFDAGLIKKAYHRVGGTAFTDDASVLEAMGEPIHLYDGIHENIKITFPHDLVYAKSILENNRIES